HVTQAAVKRDECAFDRRDDIRCRQPADEENGVALHLGYLHPPRQAAHHRVEELVQDRPAVVDLGLRDELRVAGDVGQHQCAFLQAGETGRVRRAHPRNFFETMSIEVCSTSMMRSICCSVMTKGGEIASTSPMSGRTMTPSSSAASHTLRA